MHVKMFANLMCIVGLLTTALGLIRLHPDGKSMIFRVLVIFSFFVFGSPQVQMNLLHLKALLNAAILAL